MNVKRILSCSLLIYMDSYCFIANILEPSYGTCLRKVLENLDFSEAPITYVQNNSRYLPILNTNPYEVLGQNLVDKNEDYSARNYVINTQTSGELQETLAALAGGASWYPEGFFAVLTSWPEDIENIFRTLWNFDVYRVLVFTILEEEIFMIYNSQPFLRKTACTNEVFLQELSLCGSVNIPKKSINLRVEKGCNFIVNHLSKIISWPYSGNLTSKNPGTFIVPLNLLVQKLEMNLTYIIEPAEIQFEHLEHKFGRFEEMVRSKKIDTFAFIRLYHTPIEATRMFFYDPYFWIYLKPQRLSGIKLFAVVFEWSTWLGMLAILLLVSSIYFFLQIWPHHMGYVEKVSYSFIDMSVGDTDSIQSFRNKPKFLKRILLGYLLYSLITYNAFQSRLVSVLTNPPFEPGIKTVEDLLNSNVVPLMHVGIRRTLLNSTAPLAKKMYEKSAPLVVSGGATRLFQVIQLKNISSSIAESVLNCYPIQKEMVNPIGSNFQFPIFGRYAFRRGHPFLPTFNRIIDGIIEGGLAQQWLSSITNRTYAGETQNILTLKHFGGVFLLYSVMNTLAFVSFIVEIVLSKIKETSVF